MTKQKYNVLFISSDNSARGPIAESLINRWGVGRFGGYSAGSNPANEIHSLTKWILEKNQYVTNVLSCKGLDGFVQSQSPVFDFVITLSDEVDDAAIAKLPGNPIHAHWGTDDPKLTEGLEINKKTAFQRTFSELENRVSVFVSLPLESLDNLKLKQRLDEIGRDSVTSESTGEPKKLSEGSNKKALVAYSFLVVFANDDTIDDGELAMLEKLALEDGVVDAEEKKVLANIFSRVSKEQLTDKVWQEIQDFRRQNDI